MNDAKAVAAFIKANDISRVVEGWANQPDPRKPGGGGTYKLDDGRSFRLTLAQCRLLPDGYPKWKLS